MARGLIADLAFYRDPLNSNSLYIGENPEVTVYEAGTTTLVNPATIYAVPSGGSPLGTNPVQGNADGSFVFWIDNPRLVKLKINVPGIGELTRDNVPTWTDPAQDVTLNGFQIFSNKTMEDWLSKDGAFFDVGAYRYNSSTLLYDPNGLDPYDLNNDATPALKLACQAAMDIGGGHVFISKMISIKTRFDHIYTNVKIVCVGDGTVNSAQKVGIRLDTATYPCITVRDKESAFGTAAYTNSGNEVQFHDVAFYFNNTIATGTGTFAGVKSVVLVYKSGPVADGSAPGFNTDRDFNGRVHFHGCSFTGGINNIQIGLNAVKGAGEVIIDHCKFISSESSILEHGVDYLFIHNIIAGQTVRASTTAFLHLAGTALDQPDSLVVRDVFTEDYWGGILIRHGAGSVGNAYIESCVFDGCLFGIWIDAGGTVNGLVIRNNYITGYSTGNGTTGIYLGGADSNPATHEAGDHELVPNGYGILIQAQGAGSVGGLYIHNNTIRAFTRQAINITAPSALGKIVDIDIEHNRCFDCGMLNSAGEAMIDICSTANGSTLFGVVRLSVRFNSIRTAGVFGDAHATGTIIGYGVAIGLTCDDFIVEGNSALTATIARVNKLQPGNLTDKVYRNNLGPRPSTEAPTPMSFNISFVGVNLAGNNVNTELSRPTASGVVGDAINFWVAPFDCVVVAISAGANVVPNQNVSIQAKVEGTVNTSLTATITTSNPIGVSPMGTEVSVPQANKLRGVLSNPGTLTSFDVGADFAIVSIGS